jgi:hypothetical protein
MEIKVGDEICLRCGEMHICESSASPSGYTLDFTRGVVYALARLIELHDQPTMADSVLREARLNDADLRRCAEYDLEFLRRSNPDMPKGV